MRNSSNASIATLLANASQCIDVLDAEILLSRTLKQPREFFLSHPEVTISWLERLRFHYTLNKRKRGTPLAYLTGHKEFYGLDFVVNKHTLIPRPETELLVECAIEEIGKLGNKEIPITLIDAGTGSGCIPIAVAKTVQQRNITTLAIDISRGALKIAKQNAKRHDTNITFLHGNLLSPLIRNSTLFLIRNSSLVITANLPYLTQEQFDEEPSIQCEPHSALVAEENGLALYRRLLEQVNFLISQFRNFPITIFLEIDPSQTDRIQKLIKQHLPQSTIEIKKDLREQDRVVIISLT